MPVILENGSEDIRTWLDPKRSTWTNELQSLLKPFEGELECYPVSKDVGKVGNNSPTFIIPAASSENKSNIANFFAKGAAKGDPKTTTAGKSYEGQKAEEVASPIKHEPGGDRETVSHETTEDKAPFLVPKEGHKGVKRELNDVPDDEEPAKKMTKTSTSPGKMSPSKPTKKTRNATSNNTASPSKAASKAKGSQKITSFFGK